MGQMSWSYESGGWGGLTGACMQITQESIQIEARRGGRGMAGTM